MKQGIFAYLLLGFMVLVLVSCQATEIKTSTPTTQEIGKVIKVEGGAYKDLSAVELNTLIENKDFTLINVHIPFEGNLPKTDLSIPFDMIGQNLDKLPGDKAAKIVVYCVSGSISTIAAAELVKLGYTNIWNLEGGMFAWKQAGLLINK